MFPLGNASSVELKGFGKLCQLFQISERGQYLAALGSSHPQQLQCQGPTQAATSMSGIFPCCNFQSSCYVSNSFAFCSLIWLFFFFFLIFPGYACTDWSCGVAGFKRRVCTQLPLSCACACAVVESLRKPVTSGTTALWQCFNVGVKPKNAWYFWVKKYLNFSTLVKKPPQNTPNTTVHRFTFSLMILSKRNINIWIFPVGWRLLSLPSNMIFSTSKI